MSQDSQAVPSSGSPAARPTRRSIPSFERSMLLPALTVMFGMQVMRVLLPLLVYVLRDRFGLQAMHLGALALVLFSFSFLVGPALRAGGARRVALVAAVGLGLCRLALQLWAWDPVVDLVLAAAGTLLFLFYLPAALVASASPAVAAGSPGATAPAAGDPTAASRQGAAGRAGVFALGILTGLALDTVLNGLLQTYDLAWRTGWFAIVIVLALVGLQWYLAYLTRAGLTSAGDLAPTASGLRFGPWVALGPMLALQMLLFENVARLTALTGLALPAAAALAGLAHLLGLAAAGWLYLPPTRVEGARGGGATSASSIAAVVSTALVVTAGVLLTLSVIPGSPEGFNSGLLFVTGQVALAYLVLVVVGSVGAGVPADSLGSGVRRGWGRLSAAHGVGMLLLVVMLFLTYSGYDIALPFSPDALPPFAALVAAVCGVWAVVGRRRAERDALPEGAFAPPPRAWRMLPALLVVAATLVPLVQWAAHTTPEAVEGGGFPVRVMTFNLHNGFGTDGDLDLEALAQVIEAENPDILGLQEVSRGWVINGTVDALTWLSERLGMEAVYGPTSGPLWGNALLTRRPIAEYDLAPLPTEDLLLRRGYIKATIDLGGGETLDVFATHYHHPDDGGPERVLESEAILAAWGKQPRTVLLGDLNAVEGDKEIELLRKSGLVEIVDIAGIEPGFTYASDDLYQRIDYILASEDLAGSGGPPPVDVHITEGTASDHLGIAATLSR